MASIPSQQNFPTSNQNPTNSIMDYFNKQTYLGNQFAVTLSPTITGSEVATLLLQNPSLKKSMFINNKMITSLTATNSAVLRVYLGPTFSVAGSAAIVTNLRPANANTTDAILTTGPTVSANGTLIDVIAATTLMTNRSTQMIIIDPGQTLLITLQASAGGTVVAYQLAWYDL